MKNVFSQFEPDQSHRKHGTSLLRAALLIVLTSASITYCFHQIYAAIFPWVQGWNIHYPPDTLTPWIAAWNTERDGIEIYVLYAGMFLIMSTVLAVLEGLKSLNSKIAMYFVLIATGVASIRFLSSLVFTPPSAALPHNSLALLLYCAGGGLFLLTLIYFQRKVSLHLEAILAMLMLAPVCFIATSPIAATNYAYIFGPAQKILDGYDLSQIYFQYDVLLSLIAALWMKLNFNLSMFQVLGQLSYFFAILTIFLISRSIFRQRALSLLLLVALVLVRYLSTPWDPVYVFQISPLRLDLWLIPFLIIYFRGPVHWLLLMSIGALMLVHGNFGLIYAIAYIQLLVTLELFSLRTHGFAKAIGKWAQPKYVFNVFIATLFLLACYLTTRAIFSSSFDATSLYQKIGIGFIPLASNSFFWAFPIVTSTAFVLLYLLRDALTPKYLALGLALLFFTLGNCIYFFGRSHELNLFSISIPLLFLLFFTLDLIDRWMSQDGDSYSSLIKNLTLLLAFIFILLTAYKCADRIRTNISAYHNNAMALSAHPGDPFAETAIETDAVLKEVHQILTPSDRISFMVSDETKEFMFYQRERNNDFFFFPFSSCIYRKDLAEFAQSRLDNGEYILVDNYYFSDVFEKHLNGINFSYPTKNGSFVLLAHRLRSP
jgi:hypothetical protein